MTSLAITRPSVTRFAFFLCLILAVATLSSCGGKSSAGDATDTGPHPGVVQSDLDPNHFHVDHPERFPIITAGEYASAPQLQVTGVISPDISKQIPVISLASGRIVEVDAKLGDYVHKGQLLFKVRSPDIAQAFSDYRKAIANEHLSKLQLDRAQVLFDKGAIPKSNLEQAQNTEDDAKVDIDTTIEHLKVLGSDPQNPSGIVPVYAPVSGVITDQQVTSAAGVQGLQSPNPFTISDLSDVWILCDVYENDLAQVHVGEFADVRSNAYPDTVLKARISNIGEILDPNIHTAKVRLVLPDLRGQLRLGMFVTATFHGLKKVMHATVPASALLHLRDRDWVYQPLAASDAASSGLFRRVEVTAGATLPGNLQEVTSGLAPGARVIQNALVFQSTVEQ